LSFLGVYNDELWLISSLFKRAAGGSSNAKYYLLGNYNFKNLSLPYNYNNVIRISKNGLAAFQGYGSLNDFYNQGFYVPTAGRNITINAAIWERYRTTSPFELLARYAPRCVNNNTVDFDFGYFYAN
jgi:hypothetical protein